MNARSLEYTKSKKSEVTIQPVNIDTLCLVGIFPFANGEGEELKKFLLEHYSFD